MFSAKVISAVVDGAKGIGLEPACALALVEVETAGVTFEKDGRTPQFLYERHIAWREAGKRSKALQARFASAGLAIPKWSRATQYKDEGSSAARLALLGRAIAIDEEIARRSASWGIGQQMGFLAEELGFKSAIEMVDHMTGSLAGQVDCLILEIKTHHLLEPLNRHDWPRVARIYNGPGYAANNYDARLADAHKRWIRKLAAPAPHDPAPGLSHDDTAALQEKLRALGYHSVGNPNGAAGSKTVGAIAQFQAHEGLPVTGVFDDATRAALAIAQPLEQSRDRKTVTAEDLKAAGSKTIKAADQVGLVAKIKVLLGGLGLAGAGAEQGGLLDHAQDADDKAHQAKGILESLQELAAPLLGHPAIWVACGVLVVAGGATWLLAGKIKALRVEDHRSGVHAGPTDEAGA